MNFLLIFFALPIAVIIISIALQRILKCPWLVAAIIFAIFLIVTFIINNLNFLIAAIVFAIISFITAFITCLVSRFLDRIGRECLCGCRRNQNDSCCSNEDNGNFLTIRSNQNNGDNCGCNQDDNGCSYQITNGNGLSARINIIPNTNNNSNNTNNGNTNGCGCRRR